MTYYSQHGADADAKDFGSGNTALQMASSANPNPNANQVMHLGCFATAEEATRALGWSAGLVVKAGSPTSEAHYAPVEP